MDATWWQLLIASAGLFTVIGGIFVTYIKAVTKTDSEKLITAAIAAFRDNELTPIVERISQEVHKIADISNRLGSVEGVVKSVSQQATVLGETIAKNAQIARDDLTGLGTRLENSTRDQTKLLVKLIEAQR